VAASGTVGILRALLTADASAYQATLKKSADATKAFGQSVTGVGQTAQKVTPQLTRLEKSFQGDKLLYTANNLTKAITNVGGAAKLTAREQEQVNRQLTEAIAKYKALGQTAPKAMVDLEKATRSATQATSGLMTRIKTIGTAVGAVSGVIAGLAVGLTTLGARGADVADVTEQFEILTAAIGLTSEALLERLQKATLGTMSRFELMKTVNQGLSQGLTLTAEQFETTADLAAVLADRIGGDTAQAFETLIKVMATGKDKQLQTIGMNIDAAKAVDAYAASLHKATKDLTEQEKQQAIVNGVLTEGRRIIGQSGKAVADAGDEAGRATAKFKNLIDATSEWVAKHPDLVAMSSAISSISLAFASLGLAAGPLLGLLRNSALWASISTGLTSVATAARLSAAAFGPLTLAVTAFFAAWKIGQMEAVKNFVAAKWLSSDDLPAVVFRLAMGLDKMSEADANAAVAATANAEAQGKKAAAIKEAARASLARQKESELAREAFERQTEADRKAIAAEQQRLDKARLATEAAKEAQRAREAAARQELADIEATRKALEGLGLMTRVSVIEAYEDFAAKEALVGAEGVKMDAFLIAMVPHLTAWAEATRRSGVEPLAELEAALARAGEALRRTMPLFDQVDLQTLPQVIGGAADEMQRLNELMNVTPEQWMRGRALDALTTFGVRSREEQQEFVETTRRMWDAIVRTYGEGSREATEVLAEMTDEQLAVIGRLPTYWQRVIVPTIGDALDAISRNVTQTFGEMLVGLEKWKDGFVAIWKSLKQAIANILADILQNFIQGFLKKLLAAIAGQRVATAVAGLVGGAAQTVAAVGTGAAIGAVAGGGAAVTGGLLASSALPAAVTMGAVPSTGLAAGGAAGTAAGAGFGGTLVALASNPVTWGVAAAALLAFGIGKKGWFRGGEEGVRVNPARDRFLRQFGPPGTGEGSGFYTLAALLTRLTGEPGGGRLFRLLRTADTMREFTAAVTMINTLLQRRGVPMQTTTPYQRRPMHEGGLVGEGGAGEVLIRALSGEGILSHRGLRTLGGPPALEAMNAGNPFPAVASAARTATRGQVAMALPATLTGVSSFGAAAGTQQVTMHVNIQAWDRADLNDAFRDEIIPRLKDALQFNQAGILTAMKQTVGGR